MSAFFFDQIDVILVWVCVKRYVHKMLTKRCVYIVPELMFRSCLCISFIILLFVCKWKYINENICAQVAPFSKICLQKGLYRCHILGFRLESSPWCLSETICAPGQIFSVHLYLCLCICVRVKIHCVESYQSWSGHLCTKWFIKIRSEAHFL